MKPWRRTAAAVLATLAPVAAWAEVVLLHNGSLLEGSVRRTSEEIVVQQPGGSIRLRPAVVAHVGDSPLAVYSWLRMNRIGSRGTSEEHQALAAWAMDNGLWPQAARELLDARQVDPRSRGLAVLESRFDELTRPRPSASSRQSGVVVASYEAPVGPDQAAEAAEPPLPRMPEDSLEFFTRRVQPLLRHGCTTAGCHRAADGDPFQLDPSWLHGHADSRSTDRNLRATLSALDLGSPDRSPLLHAAAGPHHGATPLAGPRREELLEGLTRWVYGIASLNPQELPAPPVTKSAAVRTEAPQEPPAANTSAAPAEAAVTPAAYEVTPHRLTRGGAVRPVGPRDEFDPAIFNERFRRPEDDLPLNGQPGPTR